MTIVVDASAMVELLAHTASAPMVEAAIMTGIALAPELLDVEVLSALARLERTGRADRKTVHQAVEALLTAPIERVGHRGLAPAAWTRRGNISAYDAFYVALAAHLDCPLMTADRRLAATPGLDVAVTLLPS